jgi:hypothetical protein
MRRSGTRSSPALNSHNAGSVTGGHITPTRDRWRLVQEVRQYCDALEGRIVDAGEDELVVEARGWLRRARQRAEIMDPAARAAREAAPTLRSEDLEPYLNEWSPQGPDMCVPRWRGILNFIECGDGCRPAGRRLRPL